MQGDGQNGHFRRRPPSDLVVDTTLETSHNTALHLLYYAANDIVDLLAVIREDPWITKTVSL